MTEPNALGNPQVSVVTDLLDANFWELSQREEKDQEGPGAQLSLERCLRTRVVACCPCPVSATPLCLQLIKSLAPSWQCLGLEAPQTPGGPAVSWVR